jgi:hypothetical protein
MRKFVRVTVFTAALTAMLLSALPAATAAPAKAAPGSIVIIFKDGHRQVFNLADIERVEFPASEKAEFNSSSPSRGHFFGKWEVGDGQGSNFYITLKENGDAIRSLGGDVHGKWTYANGDAQITWDDGARDAIRKVGGQFMKFAYESGRSFSDKPANVTNARNTTPNPI